MARVRSSKTDAIREEFSLIPVLLSERDREGRCRVPDLDEGAFARLVSHIGTSSPKTQRVAMRIIGLAHRVGYSEFSIAFSESIGESGGRTDHGGMDRLIGKLHTALQASAARMAEKRRWIPLSEGISPSGEGHQGTGRMN